MLRASACYLHYLQLSQRTRHGVERDQSLSFDELIENNYSNEGASKTLTAVQGICLESICYIIKLYNNNRYCLFYIFSLVN